MKKTDPKSNSDFPTDRKKPAAHEKKGGNQASKPTRSAAFRVEPEVVEDAGSKQPKQQK